MRRAGSLLIETARECAVPAGHALAVDRMQFSARVTEVISREPSIRIRREEATQVGEDEITIIATGPLTSDALANEIARLADGRGRPPLHNSAGDDMQEQKAGEAPAPHSQLYFYDSISPIVEADSIDMSKVYLAARYDKGSADYINCPMSKEDYDRFYDALISAESVEAKDWEKLNYFESCLPIEEIARRGRDTLRFGPMKPVGLDNPQTGKMPYAVVQLRQENLRADSYNLVGFQNHLKFGAQAEVLKLIPGLENARFLRFADFTYCDAADENVSGNPVRRPDLRCGRICGIHSDGNAGGNFRIAISCGRSASRAAPRNRDGIADPLHYPC